MKPIDFEAEFQKGLISSDGLSYLKEAYEYGASSSMNWLQTQLRRMVELSKNGIVIHVYEPSKMNSFNNTDYFLDWINLTFPLAIET